MHHARLTRARWPAQPIESADSRFELQSPQCTGAAARQGGIGGTGDLLGGVQIAFTTAINSAGSPAKYQNMVFTKRAIALGWKSELNVEMWRDENNKAMRIAAGADYDYVTRIPGESAVYTVTV